MGFQLAAAKIYVPQCIKKRELEMLFVATADAFQVADLSIRRLSYDDGLKMFALFTREQAQKAIQDGREAVVRPRLLQNAFQLGRQFKRDFNIKSFAEVMQIGSVIYRLLKIDFRGEPQGNIVIKHCFFSAYYSGTICRLISALDAGLLTGLSGGGNLSFIQRITEGDECCRAYLESPERLK